MTIVHEIGRILRETLANLGPTYLMALGVVAILVMLLAPKGLWGLVRSRWQTQLLPLQLRVVSFGGTSNNCPRASGTPNLPVNDSALFSFRFCAVHPKDARDCLPRQLFEVPLGRE